LNHRSEAELVAQPLTLPAVKLELDEPKPPRHLGISRPAVDRVPKNLIRLRTGIHQDLSSGSPDNSGVLIGIPIRK